MDERDRREALRERDLLCSVIDLAQHFPGRLPRASLDAVLASRTRRLVGPTTPRPRTGRETGSTPDASGPRS